MKTPLKDNQVSSTKTALLLIDVINHFEFPDGDEILRQAIGISDNIALLKARAGAAGIPIIYVNDNFGDWRSERSVLLSYCLSSKAKGRKFVQKLRPDEKDYFVLKPMHSAFYQTPLDVLLQRLERDSLILAGVTTNSCIMCTAHDANMRNLKLYVPSNCSSARTAAEHRAAIWHLQTMVGANVATATNLRF
jgi:nicotinamidase-related amidase